MRRTLLVLGSFRPDMGAFDTSASHTRRCSLQAHRRARRGRYHSEESARISAIAIVTTANHGGTLVAPKPPDLAARGMANSLRLGRCACDHHAEIAGYLLAYTSGAHRDTRSHGSTLGSTALLPSRTDALLPLAFNDPSCYDASYDRTKRVHVS